jgi:hypothetical protein
MGMVLQVLSPGMEHTEQSDVSAQVLRVASDLDQRGGTAAEEEIVEQALVLKHKR